MSNEALIAYCLISKQHFNHAKTRVQFDLTIRIVNTREGGGCLNFRLVEVSGLDSTSKIIEIKISSLQVFIYQQLLHVLFAQKQALGGSLFYLWFSLLFMFYPGFRSSRHPGKQTHKLSGQIKQVFSLRVPALRARRAITM